ncbi:MAG: hypothetical protein ACOC2H_04105 [Spirochaetota bacterium]
MIHELFRNMMTASVILLILLSGKISYAEDYQYQYFADEEGEKETYVPFSDYIPRVRKHYNTVPHNVEDYYRLYGMKQHYNENSLKKNILMLKTALNARFRHPIEALCDIQSEEEYYKYRNLMFMHINILIMRNYMKVAVRYDKREIRFYDRDFGEHLDESLRIAEEMYAEALPYWEEARRYARAASTVKITLDLGTIESERFSIMTGELDYGRIIRGHMENTRRKRDQLAGFMDDYQ